MAEKIKITKVLVKSLNDDWLSNIPSNLHSKEVFLVDDTSKSITGAWVTYELNYRYVMTQLGLEIPDTDKRELFYTVRNRVKGKLDLKGDAKQQYISFSEMIKRYCEKLATHLGFEYWGFVLDHLSCGSKDVVQTFDANMNPKLLSMDNISSFGETPFFVIICEKKATLEAIMEGMRSKGYPNGYYGFILGGYGVTTMVKLLIKLREVKKFATFVAHDLDVDGLCIYFDLKRWINAESVGINPDFLVKCGVNFDDLKETYTCSDKQVKGAYGMIDELTNASEAEKINYKKWVDFVSDSESPTKSNRAELNALTAVRMAQDPKLNKARDIIDFICEKLESERIWDVNRYNTPNASRPAYISKLISEVRKIAETIVEKPFEDFLKAKGLNYGSQWLDLVRDLYNRFIKENADYSESLKEVDSLLSEQSDKRKEAIKNTPQYNEIENALKKIRDEVKAKLLVIAPKQEDNEE